MTHRLLPKPVAGANDTSAGDAAELEEELDEVSVRCVVSFPLISSGAQLGRSGIYAIGAVFLILVP